MRTTQAHTTSLAAVALGGQRLTRQRVPVPSVGPEGGLLRVEACGVCGSDVKKYSVASMPPTILGHETVGTIEQLGETARRRWGVGEGDRVLLEEYLPCGHCAYCRTGEFRSCQETDTMRAGSIRYGSTPMDVPPALWGGYSQYLFMHPNSVLHRVPGGLAGEHAAFALPLGNGMQWAQADGGVRTGDTVVIQGPGQQGIGCLIASKATGAGLVIVSGLSRDAGRLRVASSLGADHTVDVGKERLAERVADVTGGRLADVVIDCGGGGVSTLAAALDSVRKRGTVIVASGSANGAVRQGGGPLDLNLLRKKQVVVKGVRGHGYEAVETAIGWLAAGHVPFDLVCRPAVGLAELGQALRATAVPLGADAPHSSVRPWD